jgi:hypothetical protein
MKSPCILFSNEESEDQDEEIMFVQPISISKVFLVYAERNLLQFKDVEKNKIENTEEFSSTIENLIYLNHSLGNYLGVLTGDEFCLYRLDLTE